MKSAVLVIDMQGDRQRSLFDEARLPEQADAYPDAIPPDLTLRAMANSEVAFV